MDNKDFKRPLRIRTHLLHQMGSRGSQEGIQFGMLARDWPGPTRNNYGEAILQIQYQMSRIN